MSLQTVQFETPENVQVGYRVAGPGSRFLAWLIDTILVIVVSLLLILVLIVVGLAATLFEGWFTNFGDDPKQAPQMFQYAVGFAMVIWTFSGVLYFTASELMMRGQTVGKRVIGLRVVRQNGFSIDATSILVRNIFRLVESFPLFWITPVLSSKSQRLGDMVAGTLVVFDRIESLQQIRRELSARPEEKIRYRFTDTQLSRLRPLEIELLERLLDRWDDVPAKHLADLVNRTIPILANRLQTDLPSNEDRLQFLEDLLASLFRRRDRLARQ
ncbi:MAG: RDD family protein [Planctomycetaceae bacterium]